MNRQATYSELSGVTAEDPLLSERKEGLPLGLGREEVLRKISQVLISSLP